MSHYSSLTTFYLSSAQLEWILPPDPDPRGHLIMPGDIFWSPLGKWLLASGGQKPGRLLNSLQGAGQ